MTNFHLYADSACTEPVAVVSPGTTPTHVAITPEDLEGCADGATVHKVGQTVRMYSLFMKSSSCMAASQSHSSIVCHSFRRVEEEVSTEEFVALTETTL